MSALQARLLRLLGLIAAVVLVTPGILRPLTGHPLELVNLVFHEAGHVLLAWGGSTLMLLGGSLLQVLVPAVCIGSFWRRGELYAAGVLCLWLAQSWAGVAAYVRDAPTRNLDLITGDPDTHDWWQLLGACLTPGCSHLNWADPLGRLLMVVAVLTALFGVLLALWNDVLKP
ncbi:hypothetical protein ACFFLM_09340 [Deinococcus oregonensis]|uniref:M50 family peptidase n=1 Tax=Deinococcus oregonensis TaxID=1805970 RepID=A0ABV6AXC7_9DEIO